MTKTILEVNATTGETYLRDMTPEEIAELEQVAQVEAEIHQVIQEKLLAQINGQLLLDTLVETFIPYLQQVMAGSPPVMTFDMFMRGIADGYLQKTQGEG